jgi:hypothetical protein
LTPRAHYVTVFMHMSPSVPNLIRCLLALVGVACALTGAQGQPWVKPKPTDVKFTEPTSRASNTNQAPTTSKLPELRGLDSSIRKPFELFNASDSFSGTMSTPPRRATPPPPNAKRQKELDLKKNWMFSTPEEIYGLQTPEEIMNAPEYTADGELKGPKNTIERFIERAENARTAAISNRMSSDRLSELTQREEEEAEKAKSAAEEKPVLGFLFSAQSPVTSTDAAQGFSRSIINPGGGTDRGVGDFLTFIKPEQNDHPLAKSAVQETSMQEFKKLLDPRSAPPVLNSGFGVPAPASLFTPGTATLEPASAKPLTQSPLAAPASAAPSFTPAYSAPPALPAPRYYLPPAPALELPKRKF